MVKVNLGSRNDILTGYVNIDLEKLSFKPTDKYIQANIRSLDTLFQTDSVDEIYSSHMFEHLVDWEVTDLLFKCWHVLIPGGKLIITVPDLCRLMKLYKEQFKQRRFDNLDILHMAVYGGSDEAGQVHKTVWTKEVGVFYLEREGLFHIEEIIEPSVDVRCPSSVEVTFVARAVK